MKHFFQALAVLLSTTAAAAEPLGLFTQLSDVGTVSRASAASFDKASSTYTFGASGDNMWAARDAFGFVWKQSRGDIALAARIEIQGTSTEGHRKAGLMFRQSLDPDSVYADAVVHGDGLTSLQYRSERGGPTREVQCTTHAPSMLRLEKRSDYVQLSLGNEDGIFEDSGCVIRIALHGAFYAGLVVCAHDNNAFETASFKHVVMGKPSERSKSPMYAIELLPLGSLDRKVIYHYNLPLESASFASSGDAICFRQEGQLERLALQGGAQPEPIDAENAAKCEVAHSGLLDESKAPNDAGQGGGKAWLVRVSPDGKTLAYLFGSVRADGRKPGAGDYLLRSIPIAGGEPRELARLFGGPGSLGVAPWSADGKLLVFVSREPD
jgi:TolB protein